MLRVRRRVACCGLLFVVAAASAAAMELPHWPVNYTVLKSALIVQGRFADGRGLLIDRVFYGDARPGDRIAVTRVLDLSLVTYDDFFRPCDPARRAAWRPPKEWRNVRGEPVVLFLEKDEQGAWRPAGWGSGVKWLVDGQVFGYMQLMNPGPYSLLPDTEAKHADDLYQAIRQGLEKRARYESILASPDVRRKIEGLLTFLPPGGKDDYFYEALRRLADLGPPAGAALRALAQREDNYIRRTVLEEIGRAKDPDSLPYLASVIARAQPLIRGGTYRWVKATAAERRMIDEWQVAVCSTYEIGGEQALPLLREAMADAVLLEDPYGALGCAESGLKAHPSVEDLPVFFRNYEHYPRWYRWPAAPKWASWSAVGFLARHKFPESVPLLAEQLDHPDLTTPDFVHSTLVEIVGRDLGRDKQAWLDWYAQRQRAAQREN